MAEHQDQHTGQHKHKSSEEPYPHHEAPTTTGGKSASGEHSGEHRTEHRSEHRGEHESGRRENEGGRGGHESGSRGNEGRGSGNDDLKSREYKGPDGEIHHHTTTYMEQHKGESGRKENESSSEGNRRKAS